MAITALKASIKLASVVVRVSQKNYDLIKDGVAIIPNRNTVYDIESETLTAGEIKFVVDNACSEEFEKSDILDIDIQTIIVKG